MLGEESKARVEGKDMEVRSVWVQCLEQYLWKERERYFENRSKVSGLDSENQWRIF